MKSAALVVIGDEILTGKIKDENSFVFAKIMFEQGIKVERIIVIPDDVETIARVVRKFSNRYDYVCTSGGVGPTHDDKTFDGIACGFSLPMHEHQQALDYFRQAQMRAGRGDVVTSAQKKMLCFPDPSQVFFMEPLWLPLVVTNNVYVFPGVPFLFEKMMTGFAHLFRSDSKFYREILFTDKSESVIAFDLKMVQEKNPHVAIGSYPQAPGKPFHVMVTVEGVEEEHVAMVAQQLLLLIAGRRTAE